MRRRDVWLIELAKAPNLDGMERCSPRRRPVRVNEPKSVRILVRVLGKFDYKSREIVFQQANYLLRCGSKHRVAKCLEYAEQPLMTKKILLAALRMLKSKITMSPLHPNDKDKAIWLFCLLRAYTFEFSSEEVERSMDIAGITGHARKQIQRISEKVIAGKTPVTMNRACPWSDDIIDLCIESAEIGS